MPSRSWWENRVVVWVDKDTHRKLQMLKIELNAKNLSETIKILVEKYYRR